MAKELQAFGGTTGQTVYARLWTGVGTIWNGSAFEAYTAGNYANYPITLTEAGTTGSYFGNFPSAITTQGSYAYEAVNRVGGSPAQTDPVVGVGSVAWGGAALAYEGTSEQVNFTGTGASAYAKSDVWLLSGEADPGSGLTQMGVDYNDNDYLNANLRSVLDTGISESVAGYLAGAFSHFFNVTSPQSTVNAMILGSTERDAVATALLDLAAGVETSKTVRQALRIILASAAGKLSGAATTNILIRDSNDTKNRINATVDSDGNRTAVSYDVS